MDKASQQIKQQLELYSNMLAELENMKKALKKVDMDSFHVAHERLMNGIEAVELSQQIEEETDEELPSKAENY